MKREMEGNYLRNFGQIGVATNVPTHQTRHRFLQNLIQLILNLTLKEKPEENS